MRTDKVVEVLQNINAYCTNSSGIANVWKHKEKKFMFQLSMKTHKDGGVTGYIFKFVDFGGDGTKKCGQLKIEGNGVVTLGPKVFKELGTIIPHKEIEVIPTEQVLNDIVEKQNNQLI